MQDSHGNEIDERDRKAYAAGWRAWFAGSADAVERADGRGVRLAWYDGYADANLADQGGHKWMSLRCRSALRHWDREGSACTCETCHRIRVEEAERCGVEAPVEEAAGTGTPEEVSEAVEAHGWHVSPAREVLARVVTLGVEVSFTRSDHYGGPISRREMG